MEDIRKVVAFDAVEEFWGLYNNIVPPSQLPGKANYYLFKVVLLLSLSFARSVIKGTLICVVLLRTGSCLHGKILKIRTEGNGRSKYQEIRQKLSLIRCGCILYVGSDLHSCPLN